MKKINLLLITMLISTVLFAQKIAITEVPAQVTSDFKNRFPAADKVVWEKDNTLLKANFINEGSKMEIAYQNNAWQLTKWAIAIEFAPQKIKDYIIQNYSAYKIKEFNFLDKNSSERLYEVVIMKKKKPNITLIFDSTAIFLRNADEEVKKEEIKKEEIKKEEVKDVKK